MMKNMLKSKLAGAINMECARSAASSMGGSLKAQAMLKRANPGKPVVSPIGAADFMQSLEEGTKQVMRQAVWDAIANEGPRIVSLETAEHNINRIQASSLGPGAVYEKWSHPVPSMFTNTRRSTSFHSGMIGGTIASIQLPSTFITDIFGSDGNPVVDVHTQSHGYAPEAPGFITRSPLVGLTVSMEQSDIAILVNNLSNPILITIPVDTTSLSLVGRKIFAQQAQCVWWNNNTYSSEGCNVTDASIMSVTCACNHLTLFAVNHDTSAPACGDGVLHPGEECDDANLMNRDGCNEHCKTEVDCTCMDEPSLCKCKLDITDNQPESVGVSAIISIDGFTSKEQFLGGQAVFQDSIAAALEVDGLGGADVVVLKVCYGEDCSVLWANERRLLRVSQKDRRLFLRASNNLDVPEVDPQLRALPTIVEFFINTGDRETINIYRQLSRPSFTFKFVNSYLVATGITLSVELSKVQVVENGDGFTKPQFAGPEDVKYGNNSFSHVFINAPDAASSDFWLQALTWTGITCAGIIGLFLLTLLKTSCKRHYANFKRRVFPRPEEGGVSQKAVHPKVLAEINKSKKRKSKYDVEPVPGMESDVNGDEIPGLFDAPATIKTLPVQNADEQSGWTIMTPSQLFLKTKVSARQGPATVTAFTSDGITGLGDLFTLTFADKTTVNVLKSELVDMLEKQSTGTNQVDDEARVVEFGHGIGRKALDSDDNAEPVQQMLASGLEWHKTGVTNPAKGYLLENLGLSQALQRKQKFTQQEWDAFCIKNLCIGHLVKSGDFYFKPAVLDKKDSQIHSLQMEVQRLQNVNKHFGEKAAERESPILSLRHTAEQQRQQLPAEELAGSLPFTTPCDDKVEAFSAPPDDIGMSSSAPSEDFVERQMPHPVEASEHAAERQIPRGVGGEAVLPTQKNRMRRARERLARLESQIDAFFEEIPTEYLEEIANEVVEEATSPAYCGDNSKLVWSQQKSTVPGVLSISLQNRGSGSADPLLHIPDLEDFGVEMHHIPAPEPKTPAGPRTRPLFNQEAIRTAPAMNSMDDDMFAPATVPSDTGAAAGAKADNKLVDTDKTPGEHAPSGVLNLAPVAYNPVRHAAAQKLSDNIAHKHEDVPKKSSVLVQSSKINESLRQKAEYKRPSVMAQPVRETMRGKPGRETLDGSLVSDAAMPAKARQRAPLNLPPGTNGAATVVRSNLAGMSSSAGPSSRRRPPMLAPVDEGFNSATILHPAPRSPSLDAKTFDTEAEASAGIRPLDTAGRSAGVLDFNMFGDLTAPKPRAPKGRPRKNRS